MTAPVHIRKAKPDDLPAIEQLLRMHHLTTTASGYFVRKGYTEVGRREISGDVLTSTQFRGACPASASSFRNVLTDD